MDNIKKTIVLNFSKRMVYKPIVYHLVKIFDLEPNILKAAINPNEEGLLVLELKGKRANYEKSLKFLKEQNIKIESVEQEIYKNEDKCIHCGACINFCPTDALYVERPSMKIKFNSEKCIICQECILKCPMRAMELKV